MALNKTVRELPLKSTAIGSDRVLIDDGLTKTACLSSLAAYFLVSPGSITTLSGNWENTYNTVNSLSSTWQDTYNQVYSLSANWGTGAAADLGVRALTATWQDTTSQVSSLSSSWSTGATVDLGVRSLTATWQDTTSQVSSLSSSWEGVSQTTLISQLTTTTISNLKSTNTYILTSFLINIPSAGTYNLDFVLSHSSLSGTDIYFNGSCIVGLSSNNIVSFYCTTFSKQGYFGFGKQIIQAQQFTKLIAGNWGEQIRNDFDLNYNLLQINYNTTITSVISANNPTTLVFIISTYNYKFTEPSVGNGFCIIRKNNDISIQNI